MGRLRGAAVLAGFAALTLPLMPVQALLIRVSPRGARVFPHWYHRRVCHLLGMRLHIDGAVVADRPVLLVANHTSWLDIPVLSALAPVSFVAKSEIAGWPGVSALARLQRTVFVDRQRRTQTAQSAGEIAARLAGGDNVVLFAEGTSSDGNRVLPFRSSLFAAVKPGRSGPSGERPETAPPAGAEPGDPTAATPAEVVVQTVALCYTRLHGVPLGRQERSVVGWYGDMEMLGHAWQLLQAGPLDVTVRVGEPVLLDAFSDRKQLAQRSEMAVRKALVAVLRGWRIGEEREVTVVAPEPGFRSPSSGRRHAGAKWT